jgi:alkylglycerol monooxygenase
MQLNYVAFVVPAFFIFLGMEYLAAQKLKKGHFFTFESSIANISVGIAERLLSLFISAGFYGAFYWVYNNHALFHIPDHWAVWVILILVTDLVWYWYHRLGHEVNFMWGAHIVHHQSEEFNYTVSGRITVFQALVRNAFWCILPWMGFHPSMVIAMLIIHGAYSFFTHTRLIGKLGWIENILITPSHHRVHHASNEKYLDKNYGDIFVFWDKLFGTFQKEEEDPVYGLTHPLNSNSFIWQHFHYFIEMIEGIRRAESWTAKLGIVFGRPDTLDPGIRKDLEIIFLPHKKEVRPTFRFKAYLKIQMVGSLILLFFFILFIHYFDLPERLLISFVIVITLINCGALLEKRSWVFHVEYIRLLVITGLVSYELESLEFFAVSLVFVLLSSSSLLVQRWYFRFVYN